MALKKNCVSSSINVICQKPKKCIKNLTEMTQTYKNILFLMETKNGHILTFSDKMQICAVSCFATCGFVP